VWLTEQKKGATCRGEKRALLEMQIHYTHALFRSLARLCKINGALLIGQEMRRVFSENVSARRQVMIINGLCAGELQILYKIFDCVALWDYVPNWRYCSLGLIMRFARNLNFCSSDEVFWE
jgi:hypothetical protein